MRGAGAGRAARRQRTLSAEQRAPAVRRAAEAGVGDRVTVHLRDYRQERGRYDAVVSVEMIEAVGAGYRPASFAAVGRALVPGGASDCGWVHKCVFPVGSSRPSGRSRTPCASTPRRGWSTARVRPRPRRDPRRRRERFPARWGEIAWLGSDETFRRRWGCHLAYSEAGFRVGCPGVRRFAAVK
ncbi:class I SAM-dependent methyltransferase [Saccharothrix saharensis]|uniref:class I SAM-dependent methyltransferase n=1 Tax=Saccharothrix saharensis TaxID=571190 RepID=UPI001478C11E|nr:class I SAM-dependent methyltransferase [Saccharothrix saharensis]